MSKRILLADDSLTIQKVVELTFMDEDFEVDAVGSGDEAISRLSDDLPNILIADVHMPGASGYEVCRQAKAMSPDLPVLLLVGTFEALDEDEMVACGADGDLKKPFDSQELLQVVRRMTEGDAPTRGEEAAPEAVEGFETSSHDDEPSIEPPELPVTGFDLAGGAATEFGAPPPDLPVDALETAASALEGEPELQAVDLGIGGDTAWGDDDRDDDGASDQESVTGEPGMEATINDDKQEHEEVDAATGNETVFIDVIPQSDGDQDAESSASETVVERADEPASEADVEADAAEADVEVDDAMGDTDAETPEAEVSDLAAGGLSDDDVDRIARRVVELMSDDAVREVAWDVIPDLAEIVIKDRIRAIEAEAD